VIHPFSIASLIISSKSVLGYRGGNQKRYCGEKKQACLKSRGDTVEFLKVISQSAEQEGCA
jgi:hypothetical protein